MSFNVVSYFHALAHLPHLLAAKGIRLLFNMDLTPFTVSSQLYEVALNAQNAERVKLVTFDGSLGYLHNGLYRDPKLPGILK